MKYKLKDTDEMYVKVYPYRSRFVTPKYSDLEFIERDINRHIDDISSTELVQEQVYTYKENGIEYEGYTLVKLCSDIAYDRDTLKDGYCWELSWVRNGEKHSSKAWDMEDLLESVIRYNCEIVGHLSDSQKALVDIARDLYEEVRCEEDLCRFRQR